MSNAAALKAGTAKARDLINRHILNEIMIPTAQNLLQAATRGRIFLGHNMTGNTVNSYAVGVYLQGQLMYMKTSSDDIPHPLRGKLGLGQVFHAGSQRWDGDIQHKSFIGKVSTNGAMEAERSIAFVQSHKPSPKGWVLVVCNGVEYASFQESMMDIDVLTASFNNAKMFMPSMFKPIPD